MALLLGPSGVGLMGLYTSITDLTQSIAGMGINSSGVRQIAEAVGSNDSRRMAITAQVLRRTSVYLGLLGTVFLFGFAHQISRLTFDNDQRTNDIRLISLVLFFSLVSAGQSALIQGMRRIGDLAKMTILGALFGTLISIPTVYFLGKDGVALVIVLISMMGFLTSWWYRRKIKILPQPVTSLEIDQKQIDLLKLGFAFMASGLMMTGAAYLVRILITRNLGLDAAGLYQSAWNLGGLYVGFILQSMGTDFYPRLTAVADNNIECNRIVNEQTHISLLMAGPGIIATLVVAPLVIEIFYSSKFQGATELLRWLCLGMGLRIISWPMGFIIMAKGARNQLIFSEIAWASIYLFLILALINIFNLNGVGIAFFGSYAFHILINYVIARKLSNFFMTRRNITLILLFLAAIAVVFYSYYIYTPIVALSVGILTAALISIYSILEILTLIPIEKLPRFALKILQLLRLIRTTSDQANSGLLAHHDALLMSAPAYKSSIKIRQILIAFVFVNFLLMSAMNLLDNDTFLTISDFLDTFLKNYPLRLSIRHWS